MQPIRPVSILFILPERIVKRNYLVIRRLWAGKTPDKIARTVRTSLVSPRRTEQWIAPMRLLTICIDGLAWPLEEPPPYLADCLDLGAAGPLADISGGDDAWSAGNGQIWSHLDRAGFSLGLMNLPGLWPAQAVRGFMVCRQPRSGATGNWAHPPELAGDLGDYIQPKRLPAGHADWRESLKDTAFAETAALARLRFEHFRRLCSQYKPDVGALGWSALATARGLFGGESGRADLMLNQLDSYLAKLWDEFKPGVLAVTGRGWAGDPGPAIIFAPSLLKPGRIQQASQPDLLAELATLAGAPITIKGGILADLMLRGASSP